MLIMKTTSYSLVLLFLQMSLLSAQELQSIKLEWEKIPDADSYRIEIQTSADSAMTPIKSTVRKTEFVAKLAPGIYRYRVRAISIQGFEGPWSDPLKFTVAAIKIPPPPLPTPKGEKSETKLCENSTVNGSQCTLPSTLNWRKTLVGGSIFTQYDGEFPDVANSVNAGTIYPAYRAELELRKKPILVPCFNFGLIASIGMRHQSLLEKIISTPRTSLTLLSEVLIGNWQVGPFFRISENQFGLFVADTLKNYSFDKIWRLRSEFGFTLGKSSTRDIDYTVFASFGSDSSAKSKLALDGIDSSKSFAAGILAVLKATPRRWRIGLNFETSYLRWSGALGPNELATEHLNLEVGLDI